jgi:hypothetical protein
MELGMIAGALVNERDIGRSLFTPDVPFEERPLALDEYIFNSALPQALSTEAEMMTRYNREGLDGRTGCIQRIHVTGGTTGAFVESLRRYRPFTPSFMGRAEDQAYLLSVLGEPGMRLGYVHKEGLIMRHDKESFAREAIQSAYIAKLVGDYVRILYFSAYARVLMDDVKKLKETVDPFTGCFISRIPLTVVFLRFGLKAASFFAARDEAQGLEFVKMGAWRLTRALDFSDEKEGLLRKTFEKERSGWHLYYDTLTALEKALEEKDPFALTLQKRAKAIVNACKLGVRSTLLTKTPQFGSQDKWEDL